MKVEINENASAPAANNAPAMQTPTQEIIYNNKEPFEVVDDEGRKFICCKPGLLAGMNHIEMLKDTCRNVVYMNMTMPITWVRSINGEAVTMRTRREWDFLVDRVGDEGLGALMAEFIIRGIIKFGNESAEDAEAKHREQKAQLKNS